MVLKVLVVVLWLMYPPVMGDFPIQSCMTRSGMFQLAMFDSLRVPLEAKKLSWKRRSKGFHTPQQMPSLETWFTIKNELTLTWREWSP